MNNNDLLQNEVRRQLQTGEGQGTSVTAKARY